ncbi:MAG TPA: AI-2E family transporter [Dongiaceae bacterium]|nr:AI-2E family transporter [Dongiaceae bacterium]
MTESSVLPVPAESLRKAPAPAKTERAEPPPPGTATEQALGQSDMPLPTDPKTIFLGGLFGLAVLAACSVAQAIIVPVVMAIFLKLLLQPLIRLLARWRVPRPLAALAGLFLLATALLGLGVALSVPAASWGKTIQDGFPRLEQRLKPLQGPISGLQELLTKAQQAAGGAGKNPQPIAIERIGVLDLVFSGTRAALEGLITTGIVLFFMMLQGDTFLRRGIEILPNFEHKRRAVEISQQVESDISTYLFTIIGMNALVGLAVGVAMWLCGMGDPVLFGALAFILNFVPILGPLTGIALFVVAGFMRFDAIGPALLPGAVYLAIHVLEGELVTPSLLARRFTLNPVAVILSLVFWYWIWGVPGAVLAMPMLAITKIICDRIRPLKAFGHFLEGEVSAAPRYMAEAYAKKRSSTRS